MFAEYFVQRGGVAQIDFVERRLFAGDFGDALQHFQFAVDEVIHDDGVVARLDKRHKGMTADIAGPAGD